VDTHTPYRRAPLPGIDEPIPLSDAAALFGFTSDFLRQLALKGRLRAVRRTHLWLTTRRWVQAYLRSRSRKNIPIRYRGRRS